jgi:tetratricopeptide (TPR) repeat protein
VINRIPTIRCSIFLGVLVVCVAALSGACNKSSEKAFERAVDAWDSGDYKLAAEEYELYLYKYPTSQKAPDARFQLANIYYFKLGRYDQARAAYSAFLEQSPTHPYAQIARERLAEALGEMGRSYEAIAEYENLNPQDATERRRIRLCIADLYFAQRNYSQALTEYEKVVEQVPYDELSEQAYLREASIYHIERAQYQQAIPVYEKLSTMSGDAKVRIRALYGLVDCHAGLYQFDEAVKTLRAIKDDAEQADVTRRVAELESQKHEANQAKTGLQSVSQPSDKPKPDATETPTTQPAASATEPVSASKPENAASASLQNANKRKRTRSREADNSQAEGSQAGDSNERGKGLKKPENTHAEESNRNKSQKAKKSENANQPND